MAQKDKSKEELAEEMNLLKKRIAEIEALASDQQEQQIRRLATVVRDSNDAITLQDFEGRITAWNHGAKMMYGYSEKEALQMNVRQLTPPDKVTERADFVRRLMAGEKVHSFETLRVTKNGRIIDVWLTVTKVLDDAGKPIGIASTERDITERKKAEAELRETAEYLQNLIDYANAPIVVWDPQFKITRFNHAFERLTGRSTTKVLGKQMEILFPSAQAKASMELIRRTRTGERMEVVELAIQHVDGSVYTVLWNSATLFSKDGRAPVATIAQGQDITELKRTVEKIENKNKGLIFQNEEKEKRAAELAIGNKELIFQSEEKEKRAAELAIANKELIFQSEEKEKRAAELAIANKELIFQSEEKEKRAAELAIANKEIKKLNEELEERVRQRTALLTAAMKESEAFSYSVSHDLKAPLRAMSGFASILSEDYAPKLDDEGRRVVDVIKSNAGIMARLIDDLLALSHLGRQAMKIADIDMTELARGVCKELQDSLPHDRRIEVTVKALPNARADHVLVKQVFINLIGNAMKFTSHKDKAVIEIGGYDEDREHVYYVKDNGAGFDMKYADELFGVFQRLHAQEEFSGNGIGLAIVNRAIHRHGGTVRAEAEVDKGAAFYFTLPKGRQYE